MRLPWLLFLCVAPAFSLPLSGEAFTAIPTEQERARPRSAFHVQEEHEEISNIMIAVIGSGVISVLCCAITLFVAVVCLAIPTKGKRRA